MSEVSVTNGGQNADTNNGATATAEIPVGNKALLKWVAPYLQKGATLDQITAAYPAPVKKASMSAKLSQLRKWAKEKGYELPQAGRASRSSANESIDDIAAELNLTRILGHDPKGSEEQA